MDGELLVSEAWSNNANPYFEWPEAEATNGASDGVSGSGVAGYYVYFGPDEEPIQKMMVFGQLIITTQQAFL